MATIYHFEGESLPLLIDAKVTSASPKNWWPEHKPIYDIHKTYLENAAEGPFFEGTAPERVLPNEADWIDFLGFKVATPLGVPAGPLLNSSWIGFAAAFGFDILCYKTIRSCEHPGHGLPNMIYVECKDQLVSGRYPEKLYMRPMPPHEIKGVAVTNSFGMPSRDADYLAYDIPRAQQLLKRGQVMIVSVVGTACSENLNAFVQDFVRVSQQAKDYGAKIIELNLSCPNVTTGEGSIYNHPDIVHEIVSKVVQVVPDIPIVIKVGVFNNLQVMEETFLKAADAGARAVSGINTISMKVCRSDGSPALGENRIQSGICGYPIRQAAIDFTCSASMINKKNKLDLVVLTTGGAMFSEHFTEFFEAGANVAMTATGMMWNPYIAMNYHNQKETHERS